MTDRIVTVAGQQFELHVERERSKVRAGALEIEVLAVRDEEAELLIGGRTVVVPFTVDGSRISFALDGEVFIAEVGEKGARTRARHRDHSMSAPMPGLVLKILVREGDVVTRGAPLVVLEAMKMEHPIVASHDGTVVRINCREGEMVGAGLDLVELSDELTVNS